MELKRIELGKLEDLLFGGEDVPLFAGGSSDEYDLGFGHAVMFNWY